MVEVGRTILGKYRVEGLLGKGGMGVVARVVHLRLGEPMAIKMLRASVVKRPQFVHRFLREAKAAARLRSEHVCRVFDVGVLKNGAPYMIMEYLEGMDLSEHMRSHGLPQISVAVELLLQACDGLREAHDKGIVHRDIKPANFFVTQRSDGSPLIKLLDFGISKIQSDDDEMELTSTKTTLGTPVYMSPEQLRSSKQVDARADIWSLGVIMYQLLSGKRPFEGETLSSLCMNIGMDEPPPLPDTVPPELAAIVMRCLQKEPEKRFASVDELALALAPFVESAPSHSVSARRLTRMLTAAGSEATPISYESVYESVQMTPGSVQTTSSTLAGSAGQVSDSVAVVEPSAGMIRRRWRVILAAASIVVTGLAVLSIMVMRNGGEAKPPNESVSESASESASQLAGTVADARTEGPVTLAIVLDSEPRGAEVLENGVSLGLTPHELEFVGGTHRALTLALDGYRPASVNLPADAGDSGRALVTLAPIPIAGTAESDGQPEPEQPESEQPEPEQPGPTQPEPAGSVDEHGADPQVADAKGDTKEEQPPASPLKQTKPVRDTNPDQQELVEQGATLGWE